MKLWRPPYGAGADGGESWGERGGMAETLWTVDARNWQRGVGVRQVVRRSRGMVDGGILTLHEGEATTVRALPRIVRHYWARGLCFGVLRAGGEAQTPVESSAMEFWVRAVRPRV